LTGSKGRRPKYMYQDIAPVFVHYCLQATGCGHFVLSSYSYSSAKTAKNDIAVRGTRLSPEGLCQELGHKLHPGPDHPPTCQIIVLGTGIAQNYGRRSIEEGYVNTVSRRSRSRSSGTFSGSVSEAQGSEHPEEHCAGMLRRANR
jgi:hypothetical protein